MYEESEEISMNTKILKASAETTMPDSQPAEAAMETPAEPEPTPEPEPAVEPEPPAAEDAPTAGAEAGDEEEKHPEKGLTSSMFANSL